MLRDIHIKSPHTLSYYCLFHGNVKEYWEEISINSSLPSNTYSVSCDGAVRLKINGVGKNGLIFFSSAEQDVIGAV
jgi:hypothetical protein